MAEKVIKPFPLPADPTEYAHLTPKERMIAGYPYRPGNEELRDDRMRARESLHTFNNTAPKERGVRREILQKLLHPDCKNNKIFILPPFRADYGYNIKLGNNVELNYDCVILDCGPVNIGDNCLVAPGVHIYSATHPIDPAHRQDNDDYYEFTKPVNIGRNVWIGGKSVICPGVTIGDNSVIGAGSVVIKDVPANVVVAGNPAKIIRYMEGADIN